MRYDQAYADRIVDLYLLNPDYSINDIRHDFRVAGREVPCRAGVLAVIDRHNEGVSVIGRVRTAVRILDEHVLHLKAIVDSEPRYYF